jgi:hypothetical protein
MEKLTEAASNENIQDAVTARDPSRPTTLPEGGWQTYLTKRVYVPATPSLSRGSTLQHDL